jgi:hypothetical protein
LHNKELTGVNERLGGSDQERSIGGKSQSLPRER